MVTLMVRRSFSALMTMKRNECMVTLSCVISLVLSALHFKMFHHGSGAGPSHPTRSEDGKIYGLFSWHHCTLIVPFVARIQNFSHTFQPDLIFIYVDFRLCFFYLFSIFLFPEIIGYGNYCIVSPMIDHLEVELPNYVICLWNLGDF